ncbi:MAG TPA: sucrase ferredoxin [Gaiellaceae bacterium]
MSTTQPGRALCAETSRDHDEPLAATASRVDTWVLLEYRGLWAHDAVDRSTLSADVKAHLVAQRRALPHARILFIRRGERRAADGLVAFVATSGVRESELRCFEFDRYDDLVGVDLTSAGEPVDHPLFLVCTHGKHDRCCAKYGRPLYDAVRELVDDGWAWQCSHVGGDRFAGNLVTLPDGIYSGRVEPSDAWPVVEAALHGRVHLPRYRGRSCYGFAAQAAERAVREETGLLGVDEVVVRTIHGDGGGWTAEVDVEGSRYEVDVHLELGEATHLTCGSEQLRRPKRYVADLRAAGSPRGRAS